MSLPFPEPAAEVPSRAGVLLGYLDYFRSRLVSKLAALPAAELRVSRLPSGWTPMELLRHLAFTELRWLEWRFEGREIADPWGDDRDGRWYVPPGETLAGLTAALHAQAARTRAIAESHDLDERGQPGAGWDGPAPRSWSGSCSTSSRSMPATWASSTSSASWPAVRWESDGGAGAVSRPGCPRLPGRLPDG